jgi:hypothetical protein
MDANSIDTQKAQTMVFLPLTCGPRDDARPVYHTTANLPNFRLGSMAEDEKKLRSGELLNIKNDVIFFYLYTLIVYTMISIVMVIATYSIKSRTYKVPIVKL